MNAGIDDEIKFKLLQLLKDQPRLTQREMNRHMGVSLGKINFCISVLTEKGMIRVERFRNSANKTAYLYHLTPTGIKEMTRLTFSCLKQKIMEYDLVKKEIRDLFDEMRGMDPGLCDDIEMPLELRKNI